MHARRHLPSLAAAALVLSCALDAVALDDAGRHSAVEPLAKLPLSWENVYGAAAPPDIVGSPLRVLRWLPDGERFLEMRDGDIFAVDAESGGSARFVDEEALAAALATIPAIDAETARALADRTLVDDDPTASGALFEHADDLYWATLSGSTAARLTSTPAPEELAKFSPDGRFVGFVRDNDLFVVDIATRTERALTAGGSDTLRHGKADWVYFEEVFDRDWNAWWWSPDSRHIAFLRTDASMVPSFTIVDDVPAAQRVETARYPKPGEPNPRVAIGVVSVAGGPTRWVDLSQYDPADTLVTGVGFRPDGKSVWFYAQNRTQTFLDLNVAPLDGGRPQRLVHETTRAWVTIPAAPRFLAGASFLWTTERSGWQHVWLFSPDGTPRHAVTAGGWEARRVHAVDETGGWVYLSATRDSPIAANLYRARIDGSSLERLTPEAGDHVVLVAPETFRFVDTWSSMARPARVELRRADGQSTRTLDENPVPALEKYTVALPRLVEIEARDGYRLPATILEPPGFDPSKRYPVWFLTYGGPHAPSIADSWESGSARLWDQVIANAGIVVFRCDPRSASGRGAVSAWSAYRQLGVQELADITDAIEWLKRYPWVDGERVGMSGHSYGGFMTAYAMTHSRLFIAGFAGAPVTDWSDYDSIYTERYMSTPQDNPDGYERTSVVRAAADLHGTLLLVHGTMDDNVHIQNSLRFVAALQRAEKQFRFMVYPGSRHGILASHLRRLRYEFILEMLRPDAVVEPAAARAVTEF